MIYLYEKLHEVVSRLANGLLAQISVFRTYIRYVSFDRHPIGADELSRKYTYNL